MQNCIKLMTDIPSVKQDSLRHDSLKHRLAYRARGFERSLLVLVLTEARAHKRWARIY